jgi:hypothetical protein
MASNPWAIVSQAPAQTAAAPANDPWSVTSQAPATQPAPASATPSEPHGLGGFAENPSHADDAAISKGGLFGLAARVTKPIDELGAGAIKSAGQVVGNILDFFSAPRPIGNAAPEQQTPLQQRTSQHLKDAVNWLRTGDQPSGFLEHVGAIGEQVLELMGTDGLLKLAGRAPQAAEAVSGAMRAGEDLKNAQQITATLARNPKIAGLLAIGLKATRDATMLGGQTYAHTEDPEQALLAAGTAGTLRFGAEGLGAAARWVQKVRPTAVDIAGVKIPVLAPQLNEAKMPIEGGAEGAPEIAAEQQKGAQQVIGNVAKNATQTALDRVNQTRPAIAATTDAARMLPAPEGAQPFTFTLGGTPTAEEPTGQIAHPAGKVQQPAAFPPKFTTASGPEPVAGGEGTTGADVSTATAPEARGETVGGGGVLQTTNPATAESWLRQLEEVEQSSAFKSLKPAQQEAISAERERLADQLGMYHASPYAQHFGQVDTENALSHVRTFGDAADQIQAAVKPVYEKLDQVSNGDFNKYNQAAKQALRIMRSATSTDAYEAAEQRYREATGAIDDLINRHAGDVSTKDYSAAKMAWRDSSRLNELHSVFERMMNGITAEESDQGLSRVMTGRTKQLEAYLSKGQNREQIEGLIGTDGVTNLKKLTQLMSKANTNRQTVSAAREIYNRIAEHARVGGGGGLIGGAVAHWMGAPWYEGMLAGAATTEGIRAVMRDAMTNPRIGNLLDYAVEHGVSPSVYAPLIARAIVEPLEEPEPQQPEQTDQEENQQ